MRHDGEQGFPDKWETMTNEDWVEFDKHAEKEHERLKGTSTDQPFIPKNSKPPF